MKQRIKHVVVSAVTKLQKMQTIGIAASAKVLKTRIARSAYIALFHSDQEKIRSLVIPELSDILEESGESINTFVELSRLRSDEGAQQFFAALFSDNLINTYADILLQGNIVVWDSVIKPRYEPKWHTDWFYEERPWGQYWMHGKDVDLLWRRIDAQFDSSIFYTQAYSSSKTWQSHVYFPDVKVPWELSRCYHIALMGYAYERTAIEKYALFIEREWDDWLDANPYGYGINWANPMECALRAINWIIAYEATKKSDLISHDTRVKVIESLFAHMIHIEHNWEWYDSRTNNHYISNLVGYLYLCWFFQDLDGMHKKAEWVVHELIAEMNKQIFDEGLSYEGSTSYHIFVSELYAHAYAISKSLAIAWPKQAVEKLKRMYDAIDWITINDEVYVMTGDNDSSHVTWDSISDAALEMLALVPREAKEGVKWYKEFGLVIVKDKTVHLTMREPVYTNRQPSGHFHEDGLHITLAVNNQPFIVDPGTYVYTANPGMRNMFRGTKSHNAPHIDCYRALYEDEQNLDALFVMSLPEQKAHADILQDDDRICMHMYHDFFRDQYTICTHRKLIYMPQKRCIRIEDWLVRDAKDSVQVSWYFTLHPTVNPIIREKYGYVKIVAPDGTMIRMSSNLTCQLLQGSISPTYNRQQNTHLLYYMTTSLVPFEKAIFDIELI